MGNRAIKYRIYPTERQRTLIIKTIGSCRFVYNEALDRKEEAFARDKTCLSVYKLMKRLPKLKKQHPWLKEVDSIALQQSLWHLNTAYQNFFNKALHAARPKHKSRRKSRWSYTTVVTNRNIRIEGCSIFLPKVGKVKAVISREVPPGWTLKSATVSAERDMTFYVSCLFEYDDNPSSCIPDTDRAVGLDYKSDGLYMDSEGRTVGSPKYFRRSEKRLASAQRKLRHKKSGSKNYRKQLRKIAKIHRHTANQRQDFLHKKSLRIANSYDIVCIEDLDMKAMSARADRLGKATADNGWGMFTRYLEYKLSDRGKVLVRVGRYFASSQICHCCGEKNPEVRDLRVRKWTCPVCGAQHDRDRNAAVNILHEGLRIYTEENLQKAVS